MNAHQVDALVNAYLFDVDFYKDSPGEGKERLEEQRNRIVRALLQLKAPDIQQLEEKYRTQAQELHDEIEWRKSRGKTRDISREVLERALVEILSEIEHLSKGLAETQRTPREVQKKKADKVLKNVVAPKRRMEEEPEYENPEIEFEELGKEPPRRRNIVPKSPVIEETVKRTSPPALRSAAPRSSGPARAPVNPAIEEPLATQRRPNPKATGTKKIEKKGQKKKKEPIVADDEVEPVPSQEDRILEIVTKYLNKRPNVDWQERDRQEEKMKQTLFQKETQRKKESEEFKQQKKKKSRKTKKWWNS